MRFRILVALFLLLVVPAGAEATQSPDAADPLGGELREAMRRYFHNRLRSELGLTDEQVQKIVPKVERIEQTKTETARRRRVTVRLLQRGLRNGAADSELQALLDRWHRSEREQQELEREILAEIDAELTVRQRVQLRFFIDSFRRQIARRVQELRRP